MLEEMIALIGRIEAAIDAQPGLTRQRHGMPYGHEYRDPAEIVVGRDGFTAQVQVRHRAARGRAARAMIRISADSETAEGATLKLIGDLVHWDQALR